MVLDKTVLRMENFNVLGVHILGLLGGLQEKPIQGEHWLKRGTWTVCQFKGNPNLQDILN